MSSKEIEERKAETLLSKLTLNEKFKLLTGYFFFQTHTVPRLGIRTFKITDGLVHTESSLKGKEIELYPKGNISLDSYLDLSLEMRLSPQLSEQIANEALTKYFKDERGWTVLALAIKGPTDEVVVMPASSTIKNISEMIIDILLKKEDDIDSDKRQDKKKALENLIKGLIKKSKEGKKGQLE